MAEPSFKEAGGRLHKGLFERFLGLPKAAKEQYLLFVWSNLSLLLVVLSVLNFDYVQSLRSQLIDFTAPLVRVISKPIEWTQELTEEIGDFWQSYQLVHQLRTENRQLEHWRITAARLERDNAELRQLLNVSPEVDYKTRTARVLTYSSNIFYKSILMNAGQVEGVNEGDIVMLPDGLIGRVVDVYENTARALLITDLNSRIPVLIEAAQAQGILTGQNDDEMMIQMKDLQDVHLVQKGMRVSTSGYGGGLWPGMPVGEVTRVLKDYVYVRPFVPLDRLTFVRIVDQPQEH